ncbi:HNH endonuclease [Marinibaculum pumilum]|uniref:HNH endonuclease n=1 Tax=Marinibaculum pumilum TaxID=1766165 RepID=A0ABV7KZU1_9PROT
MGFGVFIHRSDSIYDDRPEEQYQFPRQYLERVRACTGDWIIYYEPVKATGSRGYFAVAKVQEVIPDPAASAADLYLALIEPGSYLDFATPVPFRRGDAVVERGVLNAQGRISGRAQAAVRPLSVSDFNRILALGLDEADPLLPRTGDAPAGLQEQQAPWAGDAARDRVQALTSRIVRDRLFRRLVLRAYDERCAVSGLKLINGGGRAEVDAAHIKPVAAHGPDIVTNGIALSGTAHWMFDRGLIGLSDDLEILVSRQVNDPDTIRGFINPSGHAIPPRRSQDHPHRRFLQWHREHCFKI